MSVLNRDQILENLGSAIVIHPFESKNLKGIGYNFRVGPLAWSSNTKKQLPVVEKDGTRYFLVEPNDVALVMTRESISVDSTIAGTFHSKVDKVSIGFSHISTTLDANWCGPLFIAIANNKSTTLDLRIDDTFLTLILFPIAHTDYYHHNPSGRTDIIRKLGLETDDDEDKWLSEEWRHNVNALKDHFKNNTPDNDTVAIIEKKLRIKQKKASRYASNLNYIMQLAILLACVGLGYYKFGSTPGLPASVALGVALITYTNQCFSKK